MSYMQRLISCFIAILICPVVFGAVGMTPSKGTPSCGAIQDGQNLCGTGPATFESNAVGVCPAGSFPDVGKWACYTCPAGFDRGVASIDSDRACTKTKTTSKSDRLSRATKQGSACANGSFFDGIRGGECWSCPTGYIRSAAHVDWNDACVILPKEVFAKAKEHSKARGTTCPTPRPDRNNPPLYITDIQFWDGIDGKCHSCAYGYKRTGYSVHDDRACAKVITAKQSKATRKGQAKCEDGEMTDFLKNPKQGGNCYTCPAGYDRTVYPVDGKEACETTPEIEYSIATKTTDLSCPVSQMFDFISTSDSNVRKKLRDDGIPSDTYKVNKLGTCWSCPPGATRSWSAAYASDACVLSDVGWKMPSYQHVGLFGLKGATGVIVDIINQKNDVAELAAGYYVASITKPLKDGTRETQTADEFTQEIWQGISQNPEESSLLALVAFARLQTYAKAKKSSLKPHEREFLQDFQQQVTDYRSAMAQEALNILEVWQDGAFLRYVDPRFNNRPEIVAQKLAWLSIGVVSPPVAPPDFGALIYELEEIPVIDPVVLGMTGAELSIDHGILKTLMPYDPAGDLGAKIKAKITDKLISKAEEKFIEQIEKQIYKKAMKAGGKVSAKMMLMGPNTMGPQIAFAVFLEYATQWVDFIAGATDAEPKLKANLAQAKKTYDVSRKLATVSGGSELRSHYKTIMNSSVRPSRADRLKIEQAVAQAR